MDDAAIERHIAAVRELSKTGGPLSTGAPTVSTANPHWWDSLGPTLDREDLHKEIFDATVEKFADAGHDKLALVMAGPPGAGKSYRAGKILGDDAKNYAWVDPDQFKAELLNAAMADGSIDSWFKRGALAQYESDHGDHFFPMELAALVHNESSLLAKQARDYFIDTDTNVVLDTVLSKETSARQIGDALQAAGFTVHLVDVEVSAEDSASSIAARHRERYVAALEGHDSFGGRWVPSEYARGVFNSDGVAKSVQNAERLAQDYGNVTRFERYRSRWTGEQIASVGKEVDKSRGGADAKLADSSWQSASKPHSPQMGEATRPRPANPTVDPKPGHDPQL